MPSFKLWEILAATATSLEHLKTLRRRDHVALAFGRRFAYDSLSYIGLDAVALMLADTLAQSYDRPTAAGLVRTDGDRWAEAVAMAEAFPERPAQYCVIDFRDANGKLAHLSCATNSTDNDEIAAKLSMTPQAYGATALRLSCVNLQPLRRFIIQNGAKHGVDLTHPFLPPFDSKEFKELFAPYVAVRDGAIDTAKKKREARLLAAGEASRELFETLH